MTDSGPITREQLWERLRTTSRDEIILEEMIRLGFWSPENVIPDDPTEEIRRKAEIRQELNQLSSQVYQFKDEKKVRKELLQQRLEASQRKQQENKERRERERLEKAEAWKQRQQEDIVYLGADVSSGLNQQESDLERLKSYQLPELSTPAQLSTAMGISIGELRFLAFSRKAATTTHYIRFKIPKKTGGERLISAPMPRLKNAQYWILVNILEKITPHQAAHGFRRQRSIVTNAQPHLGAKVVVNLDLQNFFPSISYKRVKGLFRSWGYSESVATILGLICTEPEIEEVELDGQTYYIALTERHLPQGAPTSPAIANLLCHRLDRRLTQLSDSLGFTYTRYADDLTFSTTENTLNQLCNLLKRVRGITIHEGFTIAEEKTRVLRSSRQQEVTGIVVNEKLNLDRKTLKRFRATLYQIEQTGIEGKHWGKGRDILSSIQGYAQYVAMVNPEKGKPLLEQVKRIREQLS